MCVCLCVCVCVSEGGVFFQLSCVDLYRSGYFRVVLHIFMCPSVLEDESLHIFYKVNVLVGLII